MTEGPINHLSYSQISTYLACPLRYRFKYVELIPPAFTASALVFGRSIHEAVEAFYHERLIGEELNPDQMTDVYRQAWLSRDAEDVRFFNGDDEQSLLEKAKRMLTAFHASVDPSAEVLGVEEFFELRLAEDVPPFQGYVDLIERTPTGKVSVVDLKTASRKPSKSQAVGNLQLTAYALGAQALGFDPDELTLRLDVLTKTKTPELTRFETTRSEDDLTRFVKLVRHIWHAIEGHDFFPREDWHCSQCAWADPCAAW